MFLSIGPRHGVQLGDVVSIGPRNGVLNFCGVVAVRWLISGYGSK